jgi:tetratricopeptide (TPR) repeat protein
MGEVYSAYDPELDRKIALKILNSDADRDGARGGGRLLREAKAIARLRHGNVVVVHDTGSFDDRVFIAMEYVEGQTLASWLAAAPRTQDEILELFVAAGRGLQAAHAAGLVHRDFKPQNVMVGDDGEVRVTDFGLARAIDTAAEPDANGGAKRAGSADPALTQTGELLGTPLYMSPEQFAAQRTDARTDQFSFCVALYQALYGQHPFGGTNLAELMAAVAEGRVQPPPPKAAVAPWLRRVLLRGIAPRPDDRFPSMDALLAALRRDTAGRRPRWLAAGGGIVVIVAAATASYLSGARRVDCDAGAGRIGAVWGPAQRAAIDKAFAATTNRRAAKALASTVAAIDRYVARWTTQYKEACEATHVRHEQMPQVLELRMTCLDERLASVRALADTLATADANVVDNAVGAADLLPSLDRCSDVPALRAVVRPPDDPATRARVTEIRERLATVAALAAAGRCEQATRLGRPLLETAKQIGYLPLQAEALHAFSRMQDTCLDSQETMKILEDAVIAAEASRYDDIAIDCTAMLGWVSAERAHDLVAARRWIRLARAMLARYPGHPLLEARVANGDGIVLLREGRLEEGLAETQRSLALYEKYLEPGSYMVATQVNNVAITLHDMGRDAEAEVAIKRALQLIRALHGDDGGQYALASVNEGEILTALRRYDEARGSIERALAIWRQQDGTQFLIGYALLDRAKLELADGQPRAARATLEESLRLLDGRDARYAAEARFTLARAMAELSPGDRARAEEMATKARAVLAADPSAASVIRALDRWQRDHARR